MSVEKYVIIPLYRGYETLGISERSDGIVHDATRQVENYDNDDLFPRFRGQAQLLAVRQTARVETKLPAPLSNGKSTVNKTSLRSELRYTGRLAKLALGSTSSV